MRERQETQQAKTRIHAMSVVDEPPPESTAFATQTDQQPPTTDWRYEQVCGGDVQAMISSHVAAMTKETGKRSRD